MSISLGLGSGPSSLFSSGGGGDWFGGITDWLGITDTGAQQRGLDTLNEQMAGANAGLDASMQPVFGMYQDAMKGRNMGDVLDTYRQQMSGTANAADPNNVENFMNPMYGRAMANATNQALAGAGSSALSTAGNNAVATGVADTTQGMWQDAFKNAMADAQNKQGVYGSIAQSDLSPSNSWAQLTSDLAGAKYDAQTAQANAAAQVAGQNRGWFSSIFNGVLG
jgi:hypothetical protein